MGRIYENRYEAYGISVGVSLDGFFSFSCLYYPLIPSDNQYSPEWESVEEVSIEIVLCTVYCGVGIILTSGDIKPYP